MTSDDDDHDDDDHSYWYAGETAGPQSGADQGVEP